MKEEEQEAARLTAVFPCVLSIIPTCIFNQKDPIILGVEVVEGIAKVGTPICVPSRVSHKDVLCVRCHAVWCWVRLGWAACLLACLLCSLWMPYR